MWSLKKFSAPGVTGIVSTFGVWSARPRPCLLSRGTGLRRSSVLVEVNRKRSSSLEGLAFDGLKSPWVSRVPERYLIPLETP